MKDLIHRTTKHDVIQVFHTKGVKGQAQKELAERVPLLTPSKRTERRRWGVHRIDKEIYTIVRPQFEVQTKKSAQLQATWYVQEVIRVI